MLQTTFDIELTCYDGEPTPEPTPTPTPPTPDSKSFTQDDLNKFLAEDRRKHQEKIQKLESSYQEALSNAQLTAAERENLETSLGDLRKQFRTKEQEAVEQTKKIESDYQQRLTAAETSAKRWQEQYTDATITRSIMDAAVTLDAYDADQIVTILRHSTKMVEKVDADGKRTGQYEPMVDFYDTNSETGEQVLTQRRPSEAVKRMGELPKYANLFKANVTGGLSATSATGSLKPGSNGVVDVTKLTTDQYLKLRKENPALLGLK
jgi:hypothetical protein